eukprot:10132122-Heterocapsa_arctica.AAC.1
MTSYVGFHRSSVTCVQASVPGAEAGGRAPCGKDARWTARRRAARVSSDVGAGGAGAGLTSGQAAGCL